MTLNEYIDRQRASVPAKPSETFGQYVARLLDGFRVVKLGDDDTHYLSDGKSVRTYFIAEELT